MSHAPLAALGAGALVLATLLVACGEKIAIPEAEGIPTNSDYLLDQSWDLDEPTDVIQSAGLLFVTQRGAGKVTKFTTSGEVEVEATGLDAPVAVADVGTPQVPGQFILVAEAGETAGGPAISIFTRELALIERVDLTGMARSLAGLTADSIDWVYVSDPDSGVVHRFAWTGEDAGWIVPQGIVTRRIQNSRSPQFVSDPRGLALDADGMLLVCDADTTRNWVVRFDPAPDPAPSGQGKLSAFRDLGCPGNPALQSYVLGVATLCDEVEVDPERLEGPGALFAPWGVALDTEGRIYVADRLNGRGQRFAPDGTFDINFATPATGVREPLRLATWTGSVRFGETTITISGARLFVLDQTLQQMLVYEDKRWTQFEGGAPGKVEP